MHKLYIRSVFLHWSFVMTCNMFSCLRTYDVNTSPLNLSDHRDIHTSWQNRPARDRRAWYCATDENIDNYQHQLEVLLDQLCVDTNALTCDDPRCENDGHRKSVEELCEYLINSCLCTGKHTLPKCTLSRGQVPLWNKRIKPLSDVLKHSGTVPFLDTGCGKRHAIHQQVCLGQSWGTRRQVIIKQLNSISELKLTNVELSSPNVPNITNGTYDLNWENLIQLVSWLHVWYLAALMTLTLLTYLSRNTVIFIRVFPHWQLK